MRAVAVFPGRREVALIERSEPRVQAPTDIRVRMLEVGVCGTDKDITTFLFGTPPDGSEYLVLGHESLGVVDQVGPAVEHMKPGDLVVGVVRHPCGQAACLACRSGHQDFCTTGAYRERGIKELHGFMTDLVIDQEPYLHLVPPALREVAILIEPLTIAEKVLLQMGEIQRRLSWRKKGQRALVLGAGPVGLLGAMGLIRAGFETWVYSRQPEPNAKAAIARKIGATYLSSEEEPVDRLVTRAGDFDLVYEAMGAPQVALDAVRLLGPNGVYVFTGVPHGESGVNFKSAEMVLNLVIKNQIIMGTVNAGPEAFAAAIKDLEVFQQRWPEAVRGLITGKYPLEEFRRPVRGEAGGIKNVIVL